MQQNDDEGVSEWCRVSRKIYKECIGRIKRECWKEICKKLDNGSAVRVTGL